MKRIGIKPISDKRRKEIEAEWGVRKALCERAGGLFVKSSDAWRCIGGVCEECGQSPDWRGLSPHEKVFRSHGGKLSMENSLMVCGKCHNEKHGIREV